MFGGAHVKTIGDAILLRVPDPGQAVLLGLHIANDVMRGHGAPAIRVGLHHGSAVERDGDYYGAAVNLAARVSAEATGGEVLVTGETAALAPAIDGVYYESRGRQALRNVREPVELFAAVRHTGVGAGRLPIDPSARWPSTPTTPPAACCTRAPRTTSARSVARASSRRDPERFLLLRTLRDG